MSFYMLHPIVIYFKDSEGHLKHDTVCIISNYNIHDKNFVYQVQNKVIGHIKENHSEITKLDYFSDGCSDQYKNCKKLVNLCHHQEDFSLEAECCFFLQQVMESLLVMVLVAQ